ncbi:MAG: alpha-L-rhamnosidase C-terminal domain-containing protein [Verrucomicrobiota bacterium]
MKILLLTFIIAGQSILLSHEHDKEKTLSEVDIIDLQIAHNTEPSFPSNTVSPRFSWRFDPKDEVLDQSAFQIMLRRRDSDETNHYSIIWDSKKIISNNNHLVSYSGPVLDTGVEYEWRVRAWTKQVTTWSDWKKFRYDSFGSDFTPTSEFICSNPIFNKAFLAARDAQLSYLKAGAQDAGTTQLISLSVALNFDSVRYFKEWLNRLFLRRLQNGCLPQSLSVDEQFSRSGCSEAGIIVPFAVGQISGDLTLNRKQLEGLIAHIENFQAYTNEQTGFFPHQFADPPKLSISEHSPPNLFSSIYLSIACRQLARLAAEVGNLPVLEQATYWDKFVSDKLNSYFQGDSFELSKLSSEELMMAYRGQTFPSSLQIAITTELKKRFSETTDLENRHLVTSSLRFLTLCGEGQMALKFAEKFANSPLDDSEDTLIKLSSLSEWQLNFLGGLSPAAPGFRTIRFAPFLVDSLNFVTVKIDSPYGPIESHWKRENSKLHYRLTVPPNTKAYVAIPTRNSDSKVFFNGSLPVDNPKVKELPMTNTRREFELVAGTYSFFESD